MSIGQEELEEMSRQNSLPVVLHGEVVEEEEEEFELPEEEQLMSELKASRDVLRRCLILLYFLDTHVDKITKREHSIMKKDIERIEIRLEEADEVIERLEEE